MLEMRRTLSSLFGTGLTVFAVAALIGCENPAGGDGGNRGEGTAALDALSGRWTITDNPWGDAHFTLVFDSAGGYEIEDREGTVFESGPVEDVTDSSFHYTIEEYSGDDEQIEIPADNYAEYEISEDKLTITFYDDETKETAFGTVKAQRLYLALIYRGEIDGSPGSYEKWIQIYNNEFPIDIWYGDNTEATPNQTADYIWFDLTEGAEGVQISEGTYTLGNGMEVAADATDAGIASDGSVSQPDLYYDSREDTPTGYTVDQLVSDASLTVERDGSRYQLTVAYTFDGGADTKKYFDLAVSETYDLSGE